MDFLTYLSCFFLGYWVAGQVFRWHLKRAIRKIAKEHNIDLTELEEQETVKKVIIPVLTTVPVDKSILLYDQKNNFLCQGQSLDEVAENLLKYKNIKVAIILHNNDKFWFVEGKVKEA
jgi:hypothetical protein